MPVAQGASDEEEEEEDGQAIPDERMIKCVSPRGEMGGKQGRSNLL